MQTGYIIRIPAALKFFLIGMPSLVLAWPALIQTFNMAWANEQYTHILLILPIAAMLIGLDWRISSARRENRNGVGLLLLGVASAIAGLSKLWSPHMTSDVRLALVMLAAIVWWVGAFVFCFGTRALQVYRVPLGFLFGLVPLPQIVLDRMIRLLQQGSAIVATLLFTTVGVPVVREGVVLTIPGLSLEIAKECSSIRSSSMLLITTIVLAQLFLHSPWRKALAIGIAVPLSVAKNGLRIFTIVMLGTHVDPGFLNGRLHRQGGIVFFLISLLAIWGVLRLLRHTESEASERCLVQGLRYSPLAVGSNPPSG